MKKNILTIIIGAVMIAGFAFYVGLKYESKNPNAAGSNFANLTPEQRQARGAGFRGDGAGQGNRGGNFTTGEILSKDDKSITIKLPQGGSKIIFFDENSKITKQIESKPDDLAVGTQVTVSGTSNPDGSENATSIQVR